MNAESFRDSHRNPLQLLGMKISADTRKAISLILCYMALLFFLIGMAARLKSNFHSRLEISTTGFVVAAVLFTLGVIVFLFSGRGRQS